MIPRYKHLLALAALALSSVFSTTSSAQYRDWDYPERARTTNFDMKHIDLRVAFDHPQKKVMGTVVTTLEGLPGREPFREFVFDAMDMTIQKVWLESKGKKTPLQFDTSESNKLRITLDKVYPFNAPISVGVQYVSFPKRGLYFTGPDSINPSKPVHIWTQGEGEDNRHWFPTYDYPNDKASYDIYVTVQANQQALSNGKLVGKEKNKDGTVTWHYNASKPFSTYLVMLGIGDYKVVERMWRGKPVQYWMYPGWEGEADRIFGLTPKMLDFFSDNLNFEYAWDKYAQIPVADFMYGGMENVGATVLNDYVFYDKKIGTDFSAEGLIAHELAHQWFGDVVTCRGWIHMWLNESFATYFEALFRESHDGKDEFDEEMQGNQNSAIGAEFTNGKKPIVSPNNYTANHYQRGSVVLNMMRHVLGDEAFWKAMNHYLNKHQFQNVITEDLKIAVEESTGQNLQWFFDQWVFKHGHPIFNVSYEYDEAAKAVRLHVVQSQVRDSLTPTFRMPVDVELTMPDGSKRMETIRVTDSAQNFVLISPQKPLMVIFDKGNTILKELRFVKSPEELRYQLMNAPRAIERSEAAKAFAASKFPFEGANRQALERAVRTDSFWSVRLYALQGLVNIADSILQIEPLITDIAMRDPRPEVRGAAIGLMSQFRDKTMAKNLLMTVLAKDSSYRNHATAMQQLAKIDKDAALDVAINSLTGYNSPRDRVKQVAMEIIAQSNSKRGLEELVKFLTAKDIMRQTRASTVDAIANMRTADSARVFQVLWNLTNNGQEPLRNTALNKLADYGDEATMRGLEQQAASRSDMKEYYEALIKRMRNRIENKKS